MPVHHLTIHVRLEIDNMVTVKMKQGETTSSLSVGYYRQLTMNMYRHLTNTSPLVGQLLVCALAKTF